MAINSITNSGIFFPGEAGAMRTSHKLHYTNVNVPQPARDDVSTSFSEMLKGFVGRVNDLQTDAEEMEETMIHAPESVDIHTVMIAQQKAEVALTFAKAVRDEAIRAYRELTNLR